MLLQLALSAALLTSAQEPVRVQATLSVPRIRTGETTVLVLSAETDGAAPNEIPVPVLPPGLDMGPVSDFSQLQMAFPGGRRRITRREILITAREPGQYRIPPVIVEIGRRRYRTTEVTLVVLPGARVPSSPGQPAPSAPLPDAVEGGREPVQLRAWAEPASVYVGQQVLYQAEALFPEELRLRQARPPVFEPPASSGFWVYDLPDAVTVNLRIIGGEAWEAQNFKQVLFPLEPGELTLPPSRMQYEVRQGLVFTPDRREARSQDVRVLVRPLPAGAPARFTGAVGRYRVSATLEPARIGVGEPATLRFTVEGAGNIKALPRPSIAVPEAVESFVAGERVQIGFAGGQVSGRKVMEWTLVPQASGMYTVPAIEYSWFDPEAGAYQAVSTGPIALVAETGQGSADSALAPLRSRSQEAPLGWTRSRAFIALQGAPLLGLLLALAGRRRRSRAPAQTVAPELAEAERRLEDPRACLEELARYARRFDSAEGRALLERIRLARYAPEAPDRAMCAELIAAARRLRRETPLRVHLLPLLLLTPLLSVPQTESTPFERGVRAYGEGAYDVAATAFAEHLRASPRDAAAWYDLGNAAMQRADPGHAAWAWLRALDLRPRDRWARHNLRTNGLTHALELAPSFPLATEELALIAAVLWWLGIGAFAGYRRRPRPALGFATAAAAVLLVACLSLIAIRTAAPRRALSLGETALRAAPALRADSLARIAPAQPLTILEQRGDWLLVRSRDLREGWIERRAAGRL